MIKNALFVILVSVLALGAGPLRAQGSGKEEKDKGIHYSKAKDVTEPELVTKVNPSYPAEAKKDKVEGQVVLDLTIDTDGSVSDTKVKKSGDSRLTEAAIRAIKQWKFKPAMNKAGKPVEVVATVTVNFKLK